MKLCDLGINNEGFIKYIKPCSIKRRLMDMGFSKNVVVIPIIEGMGIRAYKIKDSIICIRNEDADNIEVEE